MDALGSVVKHSTADPGIASSTPLTPTKITKRSFVLVLPSKKCSRASVLYTGHVKEPGLSCVMCGGRPNILHYGPLKQINFMYAPTPNGQSPSASLNKSNTPTLCSITSVEIVREKKHNSNNY